jgi:alpha-mannosidase
MPDGAAAIRLTRRTGATSIVQILSLAPGARFVAVRTEADWHERQMLLRALFPFSPNARHATLGRQFGSVEIPVHRNTSWEQARFEVAAHGWLDVGDGSGGVALLTDAVYGHSVVQRAGTTGSGGGVEVGLSLLKAGAWPDPHADEGAHVLSYALFPHAGSWQDANVPRRALELAVPLQLSTLSTRATDGPPDELVDQAGLVQVDAENVIAETVKAAWDGDGRDVVVRLFEAHNRRGTVTLTLDRPIRAASRTDLDENDLEPLPVSGASVTLTVRPHELVTVRLRT